MTVLALDVDGVLLDAKRRGLGHWQAGLFDRFGIRPEQLQTEFFAPYWRNIVTGQRPIEPDLRAALRVLDSTIDPEALLDWWFETDFGHTKDERAFFTIAAKRLGIGDDQRHEIVFVDDTVANVGTARSCGWQAIHADDDGAWIPTASRLLGLRPEGPQVGR